MLHSFAWEQRRKTRGLNSPLFGDFILKSFLGIDYIKKVTFSLHPLFRLNLTFHHIYFIGQEYKVGQILEVVFHDNVPYIAIESQVGGHKQLLKFIKVHSKFTTLPRGSFVEVRNVPKSRSALVSSGSFQLVDSRTLASAGCFSHFTHVAKRRHPACGLFISQLEKFLMFFHIKIQSFYQLQLRVDSSQAEEFWIFDGPGLLSKELSPFTSYGFYKKYKPSTFQATIFYLQASMIAGMTHYSRRRLIRTIKFQEEKAVGGQHIFVKTDLQNTSTNFCKFAKWCVLHFKTLSNFILNFTFSNMQHDGTPNTADCSFSGISMFKEKWGVLNPLIQPFCVHEYVSSSYRYSELASLTSSQKYYHINYFKTFSNLFPSREYIRVVHSESNTSTLVIHSFSEYSNFTVKFSISVHHCAVGRFLHRFNPCQVHQGSYTGLNTNTAICMDIFKPYVHPEDKITVEISGVLRGEIKHTLSSMKTA